MGRRLLSRVAINDVGPEEVEPQPAILELDDRWVSIDTAVNLVRDLNRRTSPPSFGVRATGDDTNG